MRTLSLATVTRVDSSVTPGRIHRKRDVLVFHSERERAAWLWAVEQFDRAEQERLREDETAPLRQMEREVVGRND